MNAILDLIRNDEKEQAWENINENAERTVCIPEHEKTNIFFQICLEEPDCEEEPEEEAAQEVVKYSKVLEESGKVRMFCNEFQINRQSW